MEFGWTPDQETYRAEVCDFIRSNLPPDWSSRTIAEDEDGGDDEVIQRITKVIVEKKWHIMHWPKEYGGLGLTPWQQLIYSEEATYHRFPSAGGTGTGFVGPMLMAVGTEEQKKSWLPRIAANQIRFCLLNTEPEAGSDLASLRTRAVADGDDYVVNGQKVFISGAHRADYGVMPVRTNPDVPKHAGISYLMVDMRSPGITIRPLINMTGAHEQNEVFLEDVRVPITNRIGAENEGWRLIAGGLSSVRSGATGTNRPAQVKRLFDDVVDYAKNTIVDGVPLSKRPDVRSDLAQMAIELEVAKFMLYRAVWNHVNHNPSPRENSASRLFGSLVSQRMANVAMNTLGLYGLLRKGTKYARLFGRAEQMYKETVYHTIGLGTAEINRTVIAQRGLGLPR